jgi:hypothetical protein
MVSGDGEDMGTIGHSNAKRVTLAVLAASIAALLGAPGALAEDDCVPENGCGPPVVAPPVPPDQAGDPQAVTIGATKIPDVPPYVTIPMPPYAAPKACKAKHRHSASHPKKCKKKRK